MEELHVSNIKIYVVHATLYRPSTDHHMFEHLVQYLEPILTTYGALGVFLSSIIEEIIAPIPSTLVVFSASVLLTHGKDTADALWTIIFSIMLPAAVGITIGSLFPYYLARIGEKVAIEKFGKYLGISWETIEKAQAWSKKSSSDQWIVFTARAIPGLPSVAISIMAGLVRMPVLEYMLWSFLGCLIRNFVIGCIGYWGGKQFLFVAELLSQTESKVLVVIVAILLVGLGFYAYQHTKKSRKIDTGSTTPEM